MNLIDFIESGEFNSLRTRMGASLVEYGKPDEWDGIDIDEIRRRLNTKEGIEVNFDEIQLCPDSTLEYKGQKVLVYIRDQYHGSKYSNNQYKFHVCNCSTIQDAYQRKRISRYVVSTRTDGIFIVNFVDRSTNSVDEGNEVKLSVCKNCLNKLNYKGYRGNRFRDKNKIYETFSLDDFFREYSNEQFAQRPIQTDRDAPINTYSRDWDEISRIMKERHRWRCQNCGLDLRDNHQFLHTHHIDANKSNNAYSNLECLCLECHSNMPAHASLKKTRQYREFISLFGDRINGQRQIAFWSE